MVKRKFVDNTQTSKEADADENGEGKRTSSSENLELHHVPFKILFEGQASVDLKFTAKAFPSSIGSEVLCNQFRGRPLQGQKLDLPMDYEGFIATDLKKSSGEHDSNDASEVSVAKRFKSMTYWNWDRMPSGMDKHIKLVNWMEVSQILHAPVGDI